MAKLNADEIKGLEDFLSSLGSNWEGVAKAGLFEGARVMKDGIESEIDALPTVSDRYYFGRMIPLYALRESEKKGLKEGLRIFKFERTSNGVSASTSFAGYNKNKVANILIARSLARGTSVQKPNNFVKRGFKKSEQKRINAICDKIYSIKIKDK